MANTSTSSASHREGSRQTQTSVSSEEPQAEKLSTSAASKPPEQPNAAYLPVGAVSPSATSPGEPGIMPEGGQGKPYKEGELEELQRTVPERE